MPPHSQQLTTLKLPTLLPTTLSRQLHRLYSPIKSQISPIIPSDFIRKVLLTIVAMCHYTFRLTAPSLITIRLAYTLIHVAEGYNEEQYCRLKAIGGV